MNLGEPEPEDYVIEDGRGAAYRVNLMQQDFHSWEEVVTAIAKRMDEEQFWPNVWYVSDHGNFVLLDITKELKEVPLDSPPS